MPTEAPALTVARPAAAARAAERCWDGNRRALLARQPAQMAALDGCELDVTWATARDGSVSARDADGRWWAGCSVPLLAGRALLRSLTVEPGGHCLLAPAHAGLVVAARERLGPGPVLFVVQPDLAACRMILACDDFSADVAAGRTWFFAGEDWPAAFRRAFDDHPGLALPARFVQTRLTPDGAIEPIVTAAQAAIGDVASARAATLHRRAAGRPSLDRGRAVVIAGSDFSPWAVGAGPLRAAAAAVGLAVIGYDTDDPIASSPLALAAAAEGCGTVLAVDVGRADAAPVVSAAATWVTWVTRPAVPAYPGSATEDHLIVADAAWSGLAARAGWPSDRTSVGRCPPLLPAMPPRRPAALGLIADTAPITPPEGLRDFSSHELLWEEIAAELHGDPLVVSDARAYLTARAEQFSIDPAQLDAGRFVGRLILPAYAQGLARLLVAGGLPVRLWGNGWDDLPEFRGHAAGGVDDRSAFADAVAASTALVRPTPGPAWHPVHACGRPTLAADRHGPTYLARAARLLRGTAGSSGQRGPSLADAIARLLHTPPQAFANEGG